MKKFINTAKPMAILAIFTFILLISKVSFAQDDRTPSEIDSANIRVKSLTDTIRIALEKKFGTSVRIDSTMKPECIKRARELSGEKNIQPKGRYFGGAICPVDPTFFISIKENSDDFINGLDSPTWGDVFKVFKPTRLYVELIKIKDLYYLIICIDDDYKYEY